MRPEPARAASWARQCWVSAVCNGSLCKFVTSVRNSNENNFSYMAFHAGQIGDAEMCEDIYRLTISAGVTRPYAHGGWGVRAAALAWHFFLSMAPLKATRLPLLSIKQRYT